MSRIDDVPAGGGVWDHLHDAAAERRRRGLHRELRPTTLMVTHNLGLAERCGRIERLRGAGHVDAPVS